MKTLALMDSNDDKPARGITGASARTDHSLPVARQPREQRWPSSATLPFDCPPMRAAGSFEKEPTSQPKRARIASA